MLHRLRATRDERGVSAIEYGIIASLIAVVIISVVAVLGGNLSGVFGRIPDKISSMIPDPNNGGNNGGSGNCDTSGNYTGATMWAKVDISGNNGWVSYPASALTNLQTYLSSMGGTVLVADLQSRDDDGLPEAAISSFSNFPTCTGSGLDPSQDECNSDGTYAGDTLWARIDFNGVTEWDSYPSGAGAKFRQYLTGQGVTINDWDLPAPADDGLQRYALSDWLTFPSCGSSTPGSGGNPGGGSSDPNCDSDGNFTGPATDWYWTKNEVYDNGRLITDADGTRWEGNVKPEVVTPYSYEEKGDLVGKQIQSGHVWTNGQGDTFVTDVKGFSGTLWGKQYTNFTGDLYVSYGHWLVYEHGVMFTEGDLALPDQMLSTGEGIWIPTDAHVEQGTYTQGEAGAFQGTAWDASPTFNGGIQYASAPNTGSDSVNYDYSCGGGVVG